MMGISLRGWGVVGTVAAIAAAVVAGGRPGTAQDAPRAGAVTEQTLGNLLNALGLGAKKELQRYDFAFKHTQNEQEWELSMSAVLSQDGKSVWVMAWLDELPRNAADVPVTAVLKLLHKNDSLGQGKFFAFVSTNRRFVLERVIPNENITTALFRDVLLDLGSSVVATYPDWAVANWKPGSATATSSAASANEAPRTTASPTATSRQVPTNTAVNDSKFQTNPQKR